MLLVEFKKLLEVEELALSGLGSQIALTTATWANACFEHKVKCDWRVDIAASFGVLDIVFLDQLAEFVAAIIIDL